MGSSHIGHKYVPIRFALLLTHLMFTLTVLLNPSDNVLSGIPWEQRLPYPEGTQGSEEFRARGILVVQLIVSLILQLVEFVLFIRPGYSILYPIASISSIGLHALGSWLTFFFLWESWYYTFYSVILVFCAVLPVVIEFGVVATQWCGEIEFIRNIDLKM